MEMPTEVTGSMRDAISVLIQGLRIDQLAMIEAAGKMRYKEIANSYYQLASSRERCAKELATVTSGTQAANDSHFVKQMRALVADLHEALNDENPYAALGGTVRTEDAVLDQYKRAMFHASETPASKLLSRQYAEIRDSREKLVELRDRHLPDVFPAAPPSSCGETTLR